MIIIKLGGGLGNQMFQYATAKVLAAQLGVSLKLDISHFERTTKNETARHFRLDIFPEINDAFATAEEKKK